MTRVIRVNTETGSWYYLDLRNGQWTHRNQGHDRILDLRVMTFNEIIPQIFPMPWDSPEVWKAASRPEVGTRFYITSGHAWRISTPVVSIDEDVDWPHLG